MKKQFNTKIIPFSKEGYIPPYPNAATPRERLDKIIDFTLTAVSSAGLVTSLIFIITLL